jgi:hypothetical protein
MASAWEFINDAFLASRKIKFEYREAHQVPLPVSYGNSTLGSETIAEYTVAKHWCFKPEHPDAVERLTTLHKVPRQNVRQVIMWAEYSFGVW